MHIYHGIWYPQRVQRTLIRDPEIIRVRLDPAKRELRALLDNLKILKKKNAIYQSGMVSMHVRARDALRQANR